MNMFRNLFKEAAVKDVITLFHAPSAPASIRAHTFLKQTAAQATATATQDQASSHPTKSKTDRTDFNLEVSEEPPTTDQLTSILEYLGPAKAGSVVNGATGSSDALRKFVADSKVFVRPVTVDWNNGRAVVGDSESELIKLVNSSKGEA